MHSLPSLRRIVVTGAPLALATIALGAGGMVPQGQASRPVLQKIPVDSRHVEAMSPAPLEADIYGPGWTGAELDQRVALLDSSPVTMSGAQALILATEYNFSMQSGAWSAPNRAQDLRTRIDADGVTITPRQDGDRWSFGLSLTTMGRGAGLAPVGPATLALPSDPSRLRARRGETAPTPATFSGGPRVELRRAGMTEWYVNDSRGLEQGFTLTQAPSGNPDDVVTMRLAINSTLTAESIGERGLRLVDTNGMDVLHYEGLKVVDASGRELPSWMSVAGTEIEIRFRDRSAVYPVIVDPLVTNPTYAVLAANVGDQLGVAVASDGDINNDNRTDVVIGAPRFDQGANLDAGAIYVFLGTATPGILSPLYAYFGTGGQAGGHLGAAVTLGTDFNNDGFDDILAGAPDYDNVVPEAPDAPLVPAICALPAGRVDAGRVEWLMGSATGLPFYVNRITGGACSTGGTGQKLGTSVTGLRRHNNDNFGDAAYGRVGIDSAAPVFFDGGATTVAVGLAAPPYVVGLYAFGAPANVLYANAHCGSASSWTDNDGNGYTDLVTGCADSSRFIAGEGNFGVWFGGPYANPTAAIPAGIGGPSVIAFAFYPNAHINFSASGGGDTDGDSIAETVWGAPGFTGTVAGEGAILLAIGFPGPISQLNLFNNSDLYFITDPGLAQLNGGLGGDVDIAGNDDCSGGLADFLWSWPNYDLTPNGNEGLAGVTHGAPFPDLLDPLGYSWLTADGVPGARYGTQVAWGDTDNNGASDVLVGEPFRAPGGFVWLFPSLCCNTNPVALCQDAVAELDAAGLGTITAGDIDAGSFSPDCQIDTITVFPNSFDCDDVGDVTVTLTVTDTSGNVGTCNATVSVQDNLAPTIAALPAGESLCLWPPNHRMVSIPAASYHPVVADNCAGASFYLTGCASDEPDNGNGDGNTVDDCVVSADGSSVDVRAERAGGRDGRTYGIYARAVDASGNVSATEVLIGTVEVPHSQNQHPDCL